MSAPRLLLIYASTEGHTQSIADRIRLTAQERGFAVDSFPVARVPKDVLGAEYRAVIVGSAIHLGHHDPALVAFAHRHAKELVRQTSGFFSVSLSAASHDPQRRQEAQHYVHDFIGATGFRPEFRAAFPGALLYTEYGFVKRALMKKIAKSAGLSTDVTRDHVYTHWKAVDEFANQVLDKARTASAA